MRDINIVCKHYHKFRYNKAQWANIMMDSCNCLGDLRNLCEEHQSSALHPFCFQSGQYNSLLEE